MRRPERIYRLLLKLYPARFREEYADPLERQFADEYRDAAANGGTAMFLLRAAKDLLVSLPAEFARELAQDVAYAARIYRKRFLVSSLALITMALGIGVTTGVFSVVNAVLLRSLPFAEPDRLVELSLSSRNAILGRAGFNQWKSDSRYLADATSFATSDMNLAIDGGSVRTKVAETSAPFFRVLGVQPAFGRTFADDEDEEGRDAAAVIGYGLWQQMFGGAPDVLGRRIVLNGTPAVVAGVAPAGFDYPGGVMVWLPSVFDYEKFPKSGVIFWRTVGRLKRGVTMSRARSMFQAEAGPRNTRAAILPIRDQLAGPVRQSSLVLLGLAGLVLLIACANVSHLLLARFTERRQELAVRAALGASRGRLAQQAITEGALLTCAAGALGIVVARWAAELAAKTQPATLAAQDYTVLDWRVILFALGVAALTGILFGALPALMLRDIHSPAEPMRAQAAGSNRLRAVLIAAQAAFALALVASSMVMGRAFLRLAGTDLGFHTDHVVTLNVSLSGTRYSTNAAEAGYFRGAIERLRSVPGVQSAAAAQFLPLVENMYMAQAFNLDSTRSVPATLTVSISNGYFRTMGTRILDGREFNSTDRPGSEPVMIVNKTFADLLKIDRVVGRKVAGWRGKQYTIVGVVADQRLNGPAAKPYQQAYFPFDQSAPGFATFAALVSGETQTYLAICRDAVRQFDAQIPVYDVQSLDQRLAGNLARPRFYATAVLFFAGFALLLAVTGVYGMAAFSIAQRKREIGVRMAVGAGAGRVRFMLLRHGLLPVALGVAAGAAGAFAAADSLQALISDAPPLDGLACGEAAVALVVAAAASIWIATRRIVSMDPMRSLRVE